MRRAGLIVVLVLAAGVAFALVLSSRDNGGEPAGTRAAKRIDGPLRVADGRIVGADGLPVRLLSVTEPALISGAGNNRLTEPDACGDGYLPLEQREFDDVHRFGFNSVRLGLSWANLEPDPPAGAGDSVAHTWNDEYLAVLDEAVEGFTSRGVAVVLDMHANNISPAFKRPKPERCQGSGLPTWLFPDPESTDAQKAECDFLSGRRQPGVTIDPQQGYIWAWELIARRYADDPLVVAADIFNEPRASNCPGLDLDAFYERIGSAIHEANPALLLIYQNNAARGGRFAVTRPISLPNAVYSFHFYPIDWQEGRAIVEGHLAHTAGWEAPVWIGEFGVFREKGRGAEANRSWLADLAAMMEHCRRQGVGWAFHQYAGGRGALVDRDGGEAREDWLAGLQAGF